MPRYNYKWICPECDTNMFYLDDMPVAGQALTSRGVHYVDGRAMDIGAHLTCPWCHYSFWPRTDQIKPMYDYKLGLNEPIERRFDYDGRTVYTKNYRLFRDDIAIDAFSVQSGAAIELATVINQVLKLAEETVLRDIMKREENGEV